MRVSNRSPGVDLATALNLVRPVDAALLDPEYRSGLNSEVAMKNVGETSMLPCDTPSTA